MKLCRIDTRDYDRLHDRAPQKLAICKDSLDSMIGAQDAQREPGEEGNRPAPVERRAPTAATASACSGGGRAGAA